MQIAHHVKQQILLKKAVSGDQLPSRRELAAQLNVNPNTVQKAYRLMEQEGFVKTQGNQGSFIYVDDNIYSNIENRLTLGMVIDFIKSAKELNLSFKRVIELITKLWDK
jgi:DNA-binding transcriptional regulator YhcF (GntR family)